jgi:hypothetical protein
MPEPNLYLIKANVLAETLGFSIYFSLHCNMLYFGKIKWDINNRLKEHLINNRLYLVPA